MNKCGDSRFEIIEKAKQDLLNSTNIDSSKDEMRVLDNFLFRCWQMGWLKQYNLTSDSEEEEDELLTYYCQWAKLRVISELEIPDSEPRLNVYRYKVQTQKRFLWWKWWHTELSCNSRKIAKDVYYELKDQIREKKK